MSQVCFSHRAPAVVVLISHSACQSIFASLASMPLSWPAWIVGVVCSVASAPFGLLAIALRLVAHALQASATLLEPATPTQPAIPAGQAAQATIGLMSPEKIEALLKLYEKPNLRKLVDELVEDSLKENASASAESCPGPRCCQ